MMVFAMKGGTVEFQREKSAVCILSFSVYSKKNIDKCLRVLCFFVNLRRILPTIGELLFASEANCLCYFTNYGVHTFLCTQPLERMPIHSNEGFINRKWTMKEL